nr:hypothetical protein [uncultured Pedobacter sp.]
MHDLMLKLGLYIVSTSINLYPSFRVTLKKPLLKYSGHLIYKDHTSEKHIDYSPNDKSK